MMSLDRAMMPEVPRFSKLTNCCPRIKTDIVSSFYKEYIMRKIALRLALGAMGVNAPRFVILFLMVDSLYLSRGLEGFLLAVTGIATGAVLSGGGAFIMHVIAHPTRGGPVRAFLIFTWILLLVFNVILLAPMMVMALQTSKLVAVLDTPEWQWLWSIVAIVSVEVLAGGAMAAYALLDSDDHGNSLDQLFQKVSEGFLGSTQPQSPALDHNGDSTASRKQRQL
jgi:hypothetical protein